MWEGRRERKGRGGRQDGGTWAGAVRDRMEGIKSNHAHIYDRDGRADRKNATAGELQVHARVRTGIEGVQRQHERAREEETGRGVQGPRSRALTNGAANAEQTARFGAKGTKYSGSPAGQGSRRNFRRATVYAQRNMPRMRYERCSADSCFGVRTGNPLLGRLSQVALRVERNFALSAGQRLRVQFVNHGSNFSSDVKRTGLVRSSYSVSPFSQPKAKLWITVIYVL